MECALVVAATNNQKVDQEASAKPVAPLPPVVSNANNPTLRWPVHGWLKINAYGLRMIPHSFLARTVSLASRGKQNSLYNQSKCTTELDSHTHRWELPVLCYHSIRGNYHYPFLGIKFSAILHDFIWQNYHKNQSDRYLFSHNGKPPNFLINYYILYFQMYYQYLFPTKKYPNNV